MARSMTKAERLQPNAGAWREERRAGARFAPRRIDMARVESERWDGEYVQPVRITLVRLSNRCLARRGRRHGGEGA
jgi:hypothetical protein